MSEDGSPAGTARMEPVNSEAIAEIGYAARERTLFVRFRAGGLYAYLDAPPQMFEALRRAESKGRYFLEEIDPALRFVRLA